MTESQLLADGSSCTDLDYFAESFLLKTDRLDGTYRETTDALRDIHND
jgi:hypothetical protein